MTCSDCGAKIDISEAVHDSSYGDGTLVLCRECEYKRWAEEHLQNEKDEKQANDDNKKQ